MDTPENRPDGDVRQLGDYVVGLLGRAPRQPPPPLNPTALPRSLTALVAPPTGVNEFERIAALGYPDRLVPIIPWDANVSPNSTMHARIGKPGAKDPRGKAPGVRTPDGWTGLKNWSDPNAPLPISEALASWHAMGAGVGLRMGAGLVALDVDTLDAELARRARALVDEVIPSAHVERIGRAPKFLILLRVPLDAKVPYRMVEFGRGADGKPERCELLSAGKQAVVSGVHPVTRAPYRWSTGSMPRLQDVVEATPDQIVDLFDRLAQTMPEASRVRAEGAGSDVSQPSLRGDADTVEKAVGLLPNTSALFPSRESWRDIGYAIKAALPDDPARAFEIFAAWSDRWLDPPDGIGNAPGEAEALWATLKPPFRVGASWLFAKLEESTGIQAATHFFTPIVEPPASIWDAAPPAASPTAPATFPAVQSIAGMPDVGAIPPRAWLVWPWCPANAVNAIVGAPGVSKSGFALRLAVAVASSVETVLRGSDGLSTERVQRAGPVLVYNREDDIDEMKRRVAGVCIANGLRAFPHELHVVSGVEGRRLVLVERKERGGPIIRASGYEGLRATIRELRPVLVVLDPLVSLSAGLDENSNDDMEALLAELRSLAAAERVTIIVVHHAGKNADRMSGELGASRGASAIVGAVRGGITLTAIRVQETQTEGSLKGLPAGRYVVAEGMKANYGPKADPIVYRLREIAVGNGETDVGDTVVVHEIVDRSGAAAVARQAAIARATDQGSKIAHILHEVLGGRDAVPLSSERDRLAARFCAEGFIRGTSRKAVDHKLSEVIFGKPVEILVGGQTIKMSVEQDGNSATAPRIIRREAVLHNSAECLGGLFE